MSDADRTSPPTASPTAAGRAGAGAGGVRAGRFSGHPPVARGRSWPKTRGPELAAAARELAGRLEPDPWAVRAGVIALALLALVTGIYVF